MSELTVERCEDPTCGYVVEPRNMEQCPHCKMKFHSKDCLAAHNPGGHFAPPGSNCQCHTRSKESFNDFKIKQLVDRKDLMVKYLNLKVSEEDWHGVQDAASDLRDLQVELDTRKEMNLGK